jgi:hypothetical protein
VEKELDHKGHGDDPEHGLEKAAEHVRPLAREQLGDGLHIAQAGPVHGESDHSSQENREKSDNDVHELICV